MTQTHGEPTYDHDMNDIANFKGFFFFHNVTFWNKCIVPIESSSLLTVNIVQT